MLNYQVYGETSYEFIDQIIRTVNFTEEDRFIDLGSGWLRLVLYVLYSDSSSGISCCLDVYVSADLV